MHFAGDAMARRSGTNLPIKITPRNGACAVILTDFNFHESPGLEAARARCAGSIAISDTPMLLAASA